MKRQNTRKIGAFLMSAMMALSIAGQAFAVTTPTSGGTQDVPPAKHLSSNSFTIEKDIVLFNVDQSQIYEPNVTYSYSIAPATVAAGTTVTGLIDEDNATDVATAQVRSGVAGGVKLTGNASGATPGATAQIVFGSGANRLESTNDEGAAVTESSAHVDENLTITIDPAVIYNSGNNQAGIYRYVLTDTTTAATLTAAGIERNSDYNPTLYLDVYMKYNATSTGLEPYGYVLFKGTADTGFTYDDSAEETYKLSGFDMESETNASDEIISDQYHTFNVEVTKEITGSLADKAHNFPFKTDISTSVVTSQADFYYVVTTDGTAAASADAALSATGAWSIGGLNASSALKFQNGDGILITGLPVSSNVLVSEQNDTVDSYVASAKDTDDADVVLDNNEVTKVMAANNGTAAMKNAFAVDNTPAKDEIAVTNTLEAISPTGVVLRFIPYAMMIAAGLSLMAVANKKRYAFVK